MGLSTGAEGGLPSQKDQEVEMARTSVHAQAFILLGGRYEKRQSPENTMETGVKTDGWEMTNAD